MPIGRRFSVLVVAVAGGVLLTGCGVGAAPTDTPSRSAEPSSSATRSAAPSASPIPTARPAVVSTAGLGSIRMGSPVPADNGLAAWNPRACPDGPEGGAAGMWTPTAPLTGASPLGRDTAFGLLTTNGERDAPVSLLQVWGSDFRTPSGLRVGSTDDQVHAALPTVAVQTDGTVRWYSVVDSGWRITLTVAPEDDGTEPGVVQLITVYPASERDWPWYGTDVGANCGA